MSLHYTQRSVYDALRGFGTKLVNNNWQIIQREDFPQGKSEAMNYTLCWL